MTNTQAMRLVLSLQERHGVAQDGIVGPNTVRVAKASHATDDEDREALRIVSSLSRAEREAAYTEAKRYF